MNKYIRGSITKVKDECDNTATKGWTNK